LSPSSAIARSVEGGAGHQCRHLRARVGRGADHGGALRHQSVGQGLELELLGGVEFELAAHARYGLAPPLGHALGLGCSVVVVTVAAGREPAAEHRGQGHTNEGTLDPGLHVDSFGSEVEHGRHRPLGGRALGLGTVSLGVEMFQPSGACAG